MSYFKKILFPIIMIIILLIMICVNISGCGKNNDTPDNYGEIIKAAAYLDPDLIDDEYDNHDETDPATEIISGPLSFDKTENTANTAEEITTVTKVIETAETIKSTEEITENIEIADTDTTTELYVITPSGKKYHYPTCRTVNTIKQHLTKEEAEQSGYEPCKICNPK